MAAPDRLQRWVQVAPPPELDRCVRQRLLASVEAEALARRETEDGRAESGEPAPAPTSAPVALPLAERCVYGFGLLCYGAQALGTMARFVWRAIVG